MTVYVLKFRDEFNPLPSQSMDGEFYFSSVAAIYTLFTPEQIGCGLSTLWKNEVAKGNIYANRQVLIRKCPLHGKKQATKAL